MRALASMLALMVFGCSHPGAPSAPPPRLDVPAVAAPPSDEFPSPTPPPFVGGLPASTPSGDPIVIPWVAPRIGSVRTLTEDVVLLGAGPPGKRPLTRKRFRVDEEVTAVDGDRVRALRVTAHVARVEMTIAGVPHETTVLAGGYTLALPDPDHALQLARIGDGELGTREQEELAELLQLDDANPSRVLQVVRRHPLRLGESIALADADKLVVIGPPLEPVPVVLGLVALTATTATYTTDMVVNGDDGDFAARQRYTLDRRTGQLLALEVDSAQTPLGAREPATRSHFAIAVTRW